MYSVCCVCTGCSDTYFRMADVEVKYCIERRRTPHSLSSISEHSFLPALTSDADRHLLPEHLGLGGHLGMGWLNFFVDRAARRINRVAHSLRHDPTLCGTIYAPFYNDELS